MQSMQGEMWVREHTNRVLLVSLIICRNIYIGALLERSRVDSVPWVAVRSSYALSLFAAVMQEGICLAGGTVNNPTRRVALSWRVAQPLALSVALTVGLCM